MAFVPSEEEQHAADAMLGERHPLARALARVRTVSRQTVATLALLPGSLAATLAGVEIAPLFLVSCRGGCASGSRAASSRRWTTR